MNWRRGSTASPVRMVKIGLGLIPVEALPCEAFSRRIWQLFRVRCQRFEHTVEFFHRQIALRKRREAVASSRRRSAIFSGSIPWAGASATSRASSVDLDFDCHPLRLCTMSLLALPVKRQSYCGVTSSPATASFRLDLDPSHRREFWSGSKKLVSTVDLSKIKRRTGGGTMPLGPGWRIRPGLLMLQSLAPRQPLRRRDHAIPAADLRQ